MTAKDIELRPMPQVHRPPLSVADIEDIAVTLRAWCDGMYGRSHAIEAVGRLIDSEPLLEEEMQALLGFSRAMVLTTAPMLREDGAGRWSLFWPPAHVRWGRAAEGQVSVVIDSRVRLGGELIVITHGAENVASIDPLLPIDVGPGRPFRKSLEADGIDDAFCQVVIALMPRRELLGLRLSEKPGVGRLIPDAVRREAARAALFEAYPELRRAWLYEALVDTQSGRVQSVPG